jgi:integrase
MKKLPVVTVAERDEAARLADLPAEATVALQDLTASIKDGLMAFCCSAALAVVSQLMEEELTAKVGPKGRHDLERAATRNGSAPGSVVLGGRSVPVRRPRAIRTGGGEVHLDSYAVFSDRDLLSQVAVERMLAGVATRRHALVAEPIGEELEETALGDSRTGLFGSWARAPSPQIPLVPRTARMIDLAVGERAEGPLLRRASGERLDRRTAHRWVRSIGRRAGLGHVHPHMLRAAFIMAALDAGVPLRDVQLAARHADPRTTTVYDHRRQGLDRHAAYVVVAFVSGG